MVTEYSVQNITVLRKKKSSLTFLGSGIEEITLSYKNCSKFEILLQNQYFNSLYKDKSTPFRPTHFVIGTSSAENKILFQIFCEPYKSCMLDFTWGSFLQVLYTLQ